MPADACWERALSHILGPFRTGFRVYDGKARCKLTYSALFTVTTDLSIACIISLYVCAQYITVYYLQRCYLHVQRNRPLQFSDCAINSSVYISVWKCKLQFRLLAVFRVFAALVLESSSELVNACVDFSQNTVVSETHARHRKKN